MCFRGHRAPGEEPMRYRNFCEHSNEAIDNTQRPRQPHTTDVSRRQCLRDTWGRNEHCRHDAFPQEENDDDDDDDNCNTGDSFPHEENEEDEGTDQRAGQATLG